MGAPSRELCGPSRCTAVALTLLSALTASVAPASAQELATASGFNPVTLPPIESIDAKTDITVFLGSGVPEELRLAALRRAWTADPTIRDFKGLAENDWNFNDPNSVPGFGDLGPEVDVKRMVAEIRGEAPRLAFAVEAARRTKWLLVSMARGKTHEHKEERAMGTTLFDRNPSMTK